ncbi:MAG: extracellular solute-binding protein [Chloroflexi bacterium]|nr:extracellular solute-binding protein [Chloroflexota bacterium]
MNSANDPHGHQSPTRETGRVPASLGAGETTRRPTRRTVFVGLSGGALAGILAACGQTGNQAGTSAAPQASAPAGNVTWMYSANPQSTGFDRIEAAFREKYPKINLEVLHTPKDYDSQLLAAFSAGTPPDVLRLNDDYILGYKTKNLIAPLDAYVKTNKVRAAEFYDAIYNFPVYDGKPYSWFLGANPRLIYYNVELFKRNGAPLPPKKWEKNGWTFDDFVDVAKRLSRLTGPQKVWGASVYDDTGNEQTFSINHGSPTGIYSKDGRKFTLADPPGYEAIQWIADLTHKYHVQPTRQEASELKGTDDMFINEQLAMRFSSTGFINRLRRDSSFLTWDVVPTPMKAKRMMEGSIQTYALAVGAKNPDNGWRLLHFFTEAESARIFIDNGYVIPARKQFAKDYIEHNRGKPPENIELVIESFNYQTSPNQTLDTQAARRIYRGNNINEIWDGKVTAKEGLQRVRAQVEEAIAPK